MDSHIGEKRKIEEINKEYSEEEYDNGSNYESEEDDKDSKESYTIKKHRASSALRRSKPIEGRVIGSEHGYGMKVHMMQVVNYSLIEVVS